MHPYKLPFLWATFEAFTSHTTHSVMKQHAVKGIQVFLSGNLNKKDFNQMFVLSFSKIKKYNQIKKKKKQELVFHTKYKKLNNSMFQSCLHAQMTNFLIKGCKL